MGRRGAARARTGPLTRRTASVVHDTARWPINGEVGV